MNYTVTCVYILQYQIGGIYFIMKRMNKAMQVISGACDCMEVVQHKILNQGIQSLLSMALFLIFNFWTGIKVQFQTWHKVAWVKGNQVCSYDRFQGHMPF